MHRGLVFGRVWTLEFGGDCYGFLTIYPVVSLLSFVFQLFLSLLSHVEEILDDCVADAFISRNLIIAASNGP